MAVIKPCSMPLRTLRDHSRPTIYRAARLPKPYLKGVPNRCASNLILPQILQANQDHWQAWFYCRDSVQLMPPAGSSEVMEKCSHSHTIFEPLRWVGTKFVLKVTEVSITRAILASHKTASVGPPRATSGTGESAAVSRQRGHLFQFSGILSRTDDATSSTENFLVVLAAELPQSVFW